MAKAFFPAAASAETVEICERIAREIRDQYTIGYESTNQKQDGAYRKVRLTTQAKANGKLSVRTRAGYSAGQLSSAKVPAAQIEDLPLCSQSIIRRFLWLSQAALFCAAAAMLGYCAFVLADTWIFQREASRTFDRPHLALNLQQAAALPGPGVAVLGGLMGRMEIPRLGISVVKTCRGNAGSYFAAGGRPYYWHGASWGSRERGHRRSPGYAIPAATKYRCR